VNTLLEFKRIQKVKARMDEIRVELANLDPYASPKDYNERAKLAAELRDLQEQVKKTQVKVM
jgi:hypothetical protein